MIIIDGGCRKIRRRAKETAAQHERIVKEASRLFRERGFENATAGEVMKTAGLTHGAFYAHVISKQELEKAAIAYGQTGAGGGSFDAGIQNSLPAGPRGNSRCRRRGPERSNLSDGCITRRNGTGTRCPGSAPSNESLKASGRN